MPDILFWYTAFQLYQEDLMTNLQEMSEQPLTPDSLVPIMPLEYWRMRSDGSLCRTDNASQDRVSVRAAKAANSHYHPAPNAKPDYPPASMIAISNPEMDEEDD